MEETEVIKTIREEFEKKLDEQRAEYEKKLEEEKQKHIEQIKALMTGKKEVIDETTEVEEKTTDEIVLENLRKKYKLNRS